MGLLDGLNHVPLEDREAARRRVAQFLYYSMRQISSSQTWQDEQLAKLIPAYSNSIQRLEQVDYLRVCSTQEYEREKSLIQYNRLNAIPTNQLNDVSWILARLDSTEGSDRLRLKLRLGSSSVLEKTSV